MIAQVDWNADAERMLARALSPIILSIVADEVRRGVSMLWHCRDESHEAYAVTRVDDNPREFVVVAFAGSGLLTFGPSFVHAADARGITMRVHTTSPIIARLLRRLGFDSNRPELVLRRRA